MGKRQKKVKWPLGRKGLSLLLIYRLDIRGHVYPTSNRVKITISLDTWQSWANWRFLTGHAGPAEDWALQKFLGGGKTFPNESLPKDGITRSKLREIHAQHNVQGSAQLNIPVACEEWPEVVSSTQYCHQPPLWQWMKRLNMHCKWIFLGNSPEESLIFRWKFGIYEISNVCLILTSGVDIAKENKTHSMVWSNLEGGVEENP